MSIRNLDEELNDISLRINALRNQVVTLSGLLQGTENEKVVANLASVTLALNTAAENMANTTSGHR